jgi:hypothetical protein
MPGSNQGLRLLKGVGLLLTIAIGASALPANAGILRDVLSSVGLAKPAPKDDKDGVSFPRQGFACCDLHYNKNWINDYNYAELPLIPAGTPVEVINYGRYRANLKIEGKPIVLGQEYGRDAETLDQYVKKYIVNEDPKPRIQAYPAAVQEAIRQGKVMIGMSREQVIVAVGHPMPSENVSMNAPAWRMWRTSGAEYRLYFGADGRLTKVSVDGESEDKIVYTPGR